MGNQSLAQHSKKGLTMYPVPLDRVIDFDTTGKSGFLDDLPRVRERRKPQLLRWAFR